MSTNFISVHTHDDQEEIANLFKKYDLIALPVTDAESRLAGIITIDDIVDVIDQENTEDFQKMAGIQPSEEPYLENSVLNMAKHRFIWLMVLMVSATFTGRIIQKYEMVLQSVVVLAAFIPMLMDTGGNAGAQSSTMVIRGLALGDLKTKDLFKIIRKELSVAIVVATALSVINLLRIIFLEKIEYRVAITVTITLFITIVLAKVVGAVLPVVARVVNIDPAVMASPLITTIVDAVALMVYFALAAVFLGV
jgi:magnesium transporter